MERTENKYSFGFNKLSKSWRQEQKRSALVFCGYSNDKDLCVVTALDIYIYCVLLNGGKKVTKPSFCLVP